MSLGGGVNGSWEDGGYCFQFALGLVYAVEEMYS